MTLLFLALLLDAGAGGPAHRSCRISTGQAIFCEATGHNGDVVAAGDDGLYRDCRATQGVVRSCLATHTGDVVLHRDGKYRTCHLRAGRVVRCEATGFNGTAVVLH